MTTPKRSCWSWTMSRHTILLKNKVITRQLSHVREGSGEGIPVFIPRRLPHCDLCWHWSYGSYYSLRMNDRPTDYFALLMSRYRLSSAKVAVWWRSAEYWSVHWPEVSLYCRQPATLLRFSQHQLGNAFHPIKNDRSSGIRLMSVPSTCLFVY